MAKLNWSKAHAQHRMQRYGSQPVRGDDPFIVARLLGQLRASNPHPKERRSTKAELAQQAVAAFMAWRVRRAGRP